MADDFMTNYASQAFVWQAKRGVASKPLAYENTALMIVMTSCMRCRKRTVNAQACFLTSFAALEGSLDQRGHG